MIDNSVQSPDGFLTINPSILSAHLDTHLLNSKNYAAGIHIIPLFLYESTKKKILKKINKNLSCKKIFLYLKY